MKIEPAMFRELEARVLKSEAARPAPAETPRPAAGFVNSLSSALREVNRLQLQSSAQTDSSVRGQGPQLAEVMADAEEAGLAFQMSLQFRNKALEAYQDVMRMQF